MLAAAGGAYGTVDGGGLHALHGLAVSLWCVVDLPPPMCVGRVGRTGGYGVLQELYIHPYRAPNGWANTERVHTRTLPRRAVGLYLPNWQAYRIGTISVLSKGLEPSGILSDRYL